LSSLVKYIFKLSPYAFEAMKLIHEYKAKMELPLVEAFEAAVTFYIEKGYEKEVSNPPTNASFGSYKESAIGILKNVKRARVKKKTVEISFTSISTNQTEVLCKYAVPLSSRKVDWSKVFEEVEMLEKVGTSLTNSS
jgi:hypothetical protein